MTALMVAVAQSHAVEVSCPIVQREFLLWPDEKRRLFGGIDKNMSPVFETSGTAVIEADSWAERETNSWIVPLAAGSKNVRLGFLNDYYNREPHANRDLVVDEVIVRDQSGSVVDRIGLETLSKTKCNRPHWDDSRETWDGYGLYCGTAEGGWLDVPISIPADGAYRIEVVAYQLAAGDEDAILGDSGRIGHRHITGCTGDSEQVSRTP